MSDDLSIRCACGELRGVLSAPHPGRGNRGVCYCDDCQSFAHFLGRHEEILDARGGTEIFQVSPALLSIDAGRERLACMRLTPRGLLRWYADCCRTPVGNTMPRAGVPFVGLVHSCIGPTADGRSREAVLGPVTAGVHGRFAYRSAVGSGSRAGSTTPDGAGFRIYARAPVSLVLRFLSQLVAARLRGDQRRSPFFDPATGEPVCRPRVLDDDERAALVRAGAALRG